MFQPLLVLMDLAVTLQLFNAGDVSNKGFEFEFAYATDSKKNIGMNVNFNFTYIDNEVKSCLLYTSPSPRDATLSRMPSSA